MLKLVTESVDAYKVCKSRIDAVENALEQALGSAGVEAQPAGGAATAAGRPQAADVADDAGDDDVPS